MEVSDGAEHEVITERGEGRGRGENNKERKRKKGGKKELFRLQDTVNYAHLHSKCTLQYFNKCTFNNFYFVQTGCVSNLAVWGIQETQYFRYSEAHPIEY
jgi:hypothetical protein